MIPNASDLHYFTEVAQTGNLSRAAARLGLSQPSLSLAMQRLEHCVGVELLSRGKRGVHLTPAGVKLLSKTRLLLQEWDSVQTAALATHTQVTGSYTLGVHPSVAIYSLPHFLPRLLKEFPDLNLQLVHDRSRHITEEVISLKIDIGIVVNPIRHPDLVITPLCKDEVTLWRAPKCSNPDVLICDSYLLQSLSILRRLKKTGHEFKRTMASDNLEVIKSLTEAGVGIGIIPARVVGPGSSLSRVKGTPIFSDEVSLVYRIEGKRIRALREIAEQIKAAF